VHLTQNDANVLRTRHPNFLRLEKEQGDVWTVHASSWVGSVLLPSDIRIEVEPKVPVGNLFHMVACAFDVVDCDGAEAVASNVNCSPLDIYVWVLMRRIEALIQSGLNTYYSEHTETLKSVKGKYDAGRSSVPLQRFLCTYDEQSFSTLENRAVKATLRVVGTADIETGLRRRAMRCWRLMSGIDDVALSDEFFSDLTRRRPNRRYKDVLDLCELIYRNTSFDNDCGTKRFTGFTVDMNKVFEWFVFKLLQHALSDDVVQRSTKANWALSLDHTNHLPELQPDIVVRNKLVIDAKYYSSPLNERDKLHSPNLYQLTSYMQAYNLNGMLVYPQNGVAFNHRYRIDERVFCVKTINLAGSVMDLQESVNDLVNAVKRMFPTELEMSTADNS
jgi:5-methylcytosine-specific restriction enzyme subunit McrC